METESERLLRIAISSGLAVFILALKPIWIKWLYKIGYRDWRKPDENPYATEKKPQRN